MDRIRRACIAAAAGAAFGSLARAQAPLHIVVPNPAGGTVDLLARLLAQPLGESLGRSVVVEPRPGGNTVIGTELVARAAPDGHTMVMIGTSFAVNALVRRLPYDTLKDFTPVARLVVLPYVIAVHPSVPARTLQELEALARARPGTLNYASFGLGQLAGESFKRQAGVDLNYIPYQGGVQATAGVVAGHAGVLLGPLSDATPHIAAGRLRPLALTSAQRSETLREIPTVAECGHAGFDWSAWIGAAVPSATPREIVERLASKLVQALQRPQAASVLRTLSVSPAPLGPQEFRESILAQMKTYDAVMREANIRLE